MDLIGYQSNANTIIAVLVLYKIRLEDSETFISLSDSLKNSNLTMDLVVYDNSPTPMVTAPEYINDNWKIHHIYDKTNPGVSKAYNEGFRIAKKLKKKWMLLLDQDTSFPQNAIAEYGKAVQENTNICLLAPIVISKNKIISPCRYFLNRGYSLRRIKPSIYNFKRKSLINSGMLISVDAFEKTGGYNENIRLDFADHAFVRKYKKIYDNFVVINLKCSQNFSSDQQLTVDSALMRFAFYCEGARNMAVSKADYFVLMLVVFFRSVKLFLKYASLKFFVIYYNEFLFGNPKKQN